MLAFFRANHKVPGLCDAHGIRGNGRPAPKQRDIVPGHDVTLLRGGAAVPAYAVRITQAGHLVVRTEEGEHEVSFGEVSLRMKKEEEEPV